MNDESGKTKAIEWARLALGGIMFGGVVYITAFVKELPWPIVAIPFALLINADPESVLKVIGQYLGRKK